MNILCKKCFTNKNISEFYHRQDRKSGYKSECKECTKDRVKKMREMIIDEDGLPPLENPGEYNNQEEKEQVHSILTSLGWTLNSSNEWFKESIKDKNGTWIFQHKIELTNDRWNEYQNNNIIKKMGNG